MALDCIPRAIAYVFYHLGKLIARNTLPFLLIPLLIAIGLGVGVINLSSTSDTEYLYAPTDAPSRDERSRLQDIFPHDDRNLFSTYRQPDIGGYLQIHVSSEDGGNVLNSETFEAIFELDDFVLQNTAKFKGQDFMYSDVCSLYEGNCTYNDIIEIMTGQDVDTAQVFYPVHPQNGQYYNLIQQIGGVKLDENSIIQSAGGVLLTYYVRFQKSADEEISTAWLDKLRDEMFDYEDPRIKIVFQTSLSLAQELEGALGSVIPLFAITYGVLLVFAILSTMVFDWVRCKPWVAVSGLVASMLGVVSSVGLLSTAGLPFASVVGTMPFLIMGIGLDNMFIIVSAWRYTSVRLSVEERTGETLQNVAVSITITTITDALAFGVGCLTPFRSVTIFCAYTGVAIVFVYVYMITFTAACVVYSGRREESNRHVFCCQQVTTRNKEDGACCYKVFCASGDMPALEKTSEEPPKQDRPANNGHEEDGVILPYLNKFLGSTYADFIMKLPVKIVIVVIYLGFIGGAIYGVTIMEEGLDRANLAPDDSYYRDFVEKYDRDFAELFGPVIIVAFDEKLDYSKESVRDDIAELTNKFQRNSGFYKGQEYVISWLNSYNSYLTSQGIDIDSLNKTRFVSLLREDFLQNPAFEIHKLDIIFDSSGEEILQSRIFLQSTDVQSATVATGLMEDARNIGKDSKFKLIVYNQRFIFWDNYTVVLINTLQNLGIAVVSIMIVSLFLIPSILTVLWVTLATISICSCVIGYMAIWSVPLDSVSMIDLVMCIGFSVDFAAHISYHFVASESNDSKEKARDALGHLGTPIIQGALSTVLAVMILITSTSYIFRVFFKLVFLVIGFGFFHAMFLLPVLLSTFSCSCKGKKKDNAYVEGEKAGQDNAAYHT